MDGLFFFLVAVGTLFHGADLRTDMVFYPLPTVDARRQQAAIQPLMVTCTLELLWTIIPLGLALVMFSWE